MTISDKNLIWIDLEMTGLNPDYDAIIEIATVVTDERLNIIDEGPVIAIYQDDALLNNMDAWNTSQHGRSGLLVRVRASKYSTHDAEQATLNFLRRYIKPGVSPMCGNSICQDRRFLHRNMPELERFFHYRHIDVSTLKELAKRWRPDIEPCFKRNTHRAISDIYDSIEECKFYQMHFFVDSVPTEI